jgi:hypothetical protein
LWSACDTRRKERNWQLLLKVGGMFDMQPALPAADAFIPANASKLLKQPASGAECAALRPFIWKWVALADKSCLRDSVPVLAEMAVLRDRGGCSAAGKLQSLSAVTLREFLRVFISKQPETYCQHCNCKRVHKINISMSCKHCGRGTNV